MSIPLLLAFTAGAAVSLQAYLNGQLGNHLGSPLLAGGINNVVGLTAIVVVAIATGVPGKALRQLRKGHRIRLWHVLTGANGALFVAVTATAAPKIGIALLTVALVFGQSIGSLFVDRAGLSPGGTRPLTGARIAGVLLALAAVVILAAGSSGEARIVLLALTALTGAAVALQQAGSGHLAEQMGNPLAATLANFLVGTPILIAIALVATGGSPPNDWAAPPADFLGGLLGAGIVLTMAAVVKELGALRLTLAMVAGQSVGGLVLDLVAPAPGKQVSGLTVLSVVLTLVAVWVSGRTTNAMGVKDRRKVG